MASYSIDADTIQVLYGGAVSIPMCLGTIAVPLSLIPSSPPPPSAKAAAAAAEALGPAAPSSRYTHRRYFYLRDGGELSEDCFYRWLLFHTGAMARKPRQHVQSGSDATATGGSAGDGLASVSVSGGQPQQRKRPRADGSGDRGGHNSSCSSSSSSSDSDGDDDGDGDGSGGHNGGDSDAQRKRKRRSQYRRASSSPLTSSSLDASVVVPRSPSLFYSIIHKVEFLVPGSFTNPRRVLRRPPFITEDDTWAEHLVEARVHFLPRLGIPSVLLGHQALLQRRVSGARLGLLGRAHRLPRPRPMVILDSTTKFGNNNSRDSSGGARSGCARRWAALLASVTVSERQDALRVLHPTFDVLRFAEEVRAKRESDVIARLREHFLADVYGAPPTTTEGVDGTGHTTATTPTGGGASTAAAAGVKELAFVELPVLYQQQQQQAIINIATMGTDEAAGHRTAHIDADTVAFLLPAEPCLLAHTLARTQLNVETLSGALADLREEQRLMCGGIADALKALHARATGVKAGLSALHATCLGKLNRPPQERLP